MLLVVVVLVLAAVAFVVVQLTRSVPPVTVTTATTSVVTALGATAPEWPSQGESAVGVEGAGLLATHGSELPTPLASVTKLMTAYLVLHDHPLAKTQAGPDLPITQSDVATYNADRAAGDSVVAVVAGEKLSELQALQALLIPSGDNIATLLAVWDAGSEPAFVAKMNRTAKALGLTGTHYTDASGVDPGSEGTAASQVRLAMADMALPAFTATVRMAQVTLPVAGLRYNVNAMLGKHGVVGIKTGYTTSAGGCFVFAARTTIDGAPHVLVGAVLHQFGTAAQPSALTEAFDGASRLIASVPSRVHEATVLRAGQSVGTLDAPWAPAVALRATQSVRFLSLGAWRATVSDHLPSRVQPPIGAHAVVGSASVAMGDQRTTVPLATARALPSASLSWRLSHI